MHVRQLLVVFIIGLSVSSVLGSRCGCHSKEKLEKIALRKLSRHRRSVTPAPGAPVPSGGCPDVQHFSSVKNHAPINDRSLSPWRYETKTMKNHFPSTYEEAKCLCNGCLVLKDGSWSLTTDYNSVAVTQTKLFFKRVKCKTDSDAAADDDDDYDDHDDYDDYDDDDDADDDADEDNNNKYYLKLVSKKVAVGCTCIKAKITTN